MSLSSPFIRRPVTTTLLNLSIVLAGAVAFTMLAVSPLPQVDFPVISVSAGLPGASPETMASSVATPLERALGTIAGVNEISSWSSQGSSRIMVQFDLGKDINAAAREVQAAINASRSLLPSALPGMPNYRKINPSQAPIMILALTSKTRTTSELYDLASTVLAQKVAQVTGVGDVTVGGGSLPAVRVELQPNALAQYGISLDDVRRAITGANLLRPKGLVEEGQRMWQVQASDQLSRRPPNTPLDHPLPGRRPGAAHRCRAPSSDDVEDRFNTGFFNNDPAVLLVISRQPDANIIKTVDAIREQLPGAQRVPARRGEARRGERPVAEHPCDAARRRADAAHRGAARHPRRARVPCQHPGRRDPGRGRPGGARRQLRGHVPVGLLAQQPVAHGAHRRDRPGRGRRDRGPREHLPPRRAREDARRGGVRSARARWGRRSSR